MSRAKRLSRARWYNAFLIILTFAVPALLITGVWLDGGNVFFGVIAALLSFSVLVLYILYPNWLKERD